MIMGFIGKTNIIFPTKIIKEPFYTSLLPAFFPQWALFLKVQELGLIVNDPEHKKGNPNNLKST
jgi:hypothetical protein